MIRKARERLGQTQGEFGRALEGVLGRAISQTQVSDWERGRREPSASVLLAVATLTNQALEELPASPDRARGSAPQSEEVSGLLGRVERLEEEVRQIGATLSRCVEALDQAGLLPAAENGGIAVSGSE